MCSDNVQADMIAMVAPSLVDGKAKKEKDKEKLKEEKHKKQIEEKQVQALQTVSIGLYRYNKCYNTVFVLMMC